MDKQVKCKFCKRDIVASNIVLHEARCERSNNVEISDESENTPKVQPNITSIPTKQYKKDDLRKSTTKLVTCTKCYENVPEEEMKIHHEKYCKDSTIPCEFCGKSIPLIAYEAHVEICNMNPDLQGTSNENIKIPCEICGKNIAGNLYEGHIAECQSQWERNKNKRPDSNVNYQDYDVDGDEDDNLFSHTHTNQNQQSRNRQQQQQQQRTQQQSNQNFMGMPGMMDPNQFFQQMSNNPFGNSMFNNDPFGGNPFFSRMANLGGLSNMQQSTNMNSNGGGNFQSQSTQTQSRPGGGVVITTITTGPDGRRTRTQRVINGDGNGQQGNDPHDMAGFPFIGFPFSMGPNMGLNMQQQSQQQGGNRRPISLLDLFGMSFQGMDIGELLGALGPREQGLDKEMLESFATVKFDKEKSKNLDPELKKCAICMEEFEDQEEIKFLLCTHRFHSQCIDPWLEKHTTCPVCKKDFSKLSAEDLQ